MREKILRKKHIKSELFSWMWLLFSWMWLLDVFFLIVQFGHGGVVFEEPPRKATYLLDDIDGD